MAPGQPGECNTSLESVARRALAGIRPPAALEQIAAKSPKASGRWPNWIARRERGLEAQTGLPQLVFDTPGAPVEIALRFTCADLDDRRAHRGERRAWACLPRAGRYGVERSARPYFLPCAVRRGETDWSACAPPGPPGAASTLGLTTLAGSVEYRLSAADRALATFLRRKTHIGPQRV